MSNHRGHKLTNLISRGLKGYRDGIYEYHDCDNIEIDWFKSLKHSVIVNICDIPTRKVK